MQWHGCRVAGFAYIPRPLDVCGVAFLSSGACSSFSDAVTVTRRRAIVCGIEDHLVRVAFPHVHVRVSHPNI